MNYKIQTIKDDDLNKELYNDIAELTSPANETYPERSKWLFEKFFPGVANGSRKIIIATDKNQTLAGVALLKNTKEEKKICCLYIRKDCRGHGLAGSLIQESFKILGTNTPSLSVTDKNYEQFSKLLKLHAFKFSYKKKGAYSPNDTEYYFNNEATEILKSKVLAPLFAPKLQNGK